jgi:hypothetical protein
MTALSMLAPAQSGYNLFRILLYRNDATELLVEVTSEGLRLPVLSIPIHTRAAREITAKIRSRWYMETYGLFPFTSHDPSQALLRYQVLEACQPDENPPAGLRWLAITLLSADGFQDPADYSAIEQSLVALDRYRRGTLPGIFGKPGWLRVIEEWVEAQMAARGLRLTGQFRQLNAFATFSLIRFETDGPAVWFKSVGEPNLHEYPITLALAKLFPSYMPRILGAQAQWNAWLAEEVEGVELSLSSERTLWKRAARFLAELQINSIGRTWALVDGGVRDLRFPALLPLVDPFLDTMRRFMEHQTKTPPAALAESELQFVASAIKDALSLCQEINIHSTLGHLDLNPGNIFVSKASCVFLDWADAYVGQPFFTFEYLLEHFRRRFPRESWYEQELAESYRQPWESFYSPTELADLLALTPLLALFTFAAGHDAWRDPSLLPISRAAGYFRSLTRRMRREAVRWIERTRNGRSLCLA